MIGFQVSGVRNKLFQFSVLGIRKLVIDVRYVLPDKIRCMAQGVRSIEIKVFKSKIRNPKSKMGKLNL